MLSQLPNLKINKVIINSSINYIDIIVYLQAIAEI